MLSSVLKVMFMISFLGVVSYLTILYFKKVNQSISLNHYDKSSKPEKIHEKRLNAYSDGSYLTSNVYDKTIKCSEELNITEPKLLINYKTKGWLILEDQKENFNKKNVDIFLENCTQELIKESIKEDSEKTLNRLSWN